MIDDRHRRIGVYGLAVSADRILLAQIAPEYSAPMAWTLPGGGMEYAESPRQTLAREFHEETGLHAQIGGPAFVRSGVFPQVEASLHSLQVVFDVTTSGQPRPETGGSTVDARWVEVGDVRELEVVPLVKAALDHLETRSPSATRGHNDHQVR